VTKEVTMPFRREALPHTLNGILIVVLLALAAQQIANAGPVRALGLSPLVIGILVGMVYANTLRRALPKSWAPGITFSAKTLLRVAIVFYGFRLTFQQIGAVGVEGLVLSITMVTTTFLLGAFLGQKVFGLDRDTALLTAAGSSICGAAAVLATEPVLGSEPYKSAVAVGTVVLFGTVSLFLYPVLFHTGLLPMNTREFGLYAGGTIHEVAQVVGAASAVGDEATRVAVVVKMTRVMMIAPALVVLGLVLSALARKSGARGKASKVVIPWFAVLFVAMSGVNSLGWIPGTVVGGITTADTFLMTMAMTALGLETDRAKFRQAGVRPILLALVLFLWLTVGGFFVTKFIVSFC
jgi:uncharacterized integral membrane protein (TIGR00698 family)